VYDKATNECEVSIDDTGFGSETSKTQKSSEEALRQCAYTFPELDDEEIQVFLNEINNIQNVATDEEYRNRCEKLIGGMVEYEHKDLDKKISCDFRGKPVN
jgi:hypothetical protein